MSESEVQHMNSLSIYSSKMVICLKMIKMNLSTQTWRLSEGMAGYWMYRDWMGPKYPFMFLRERLWICKKCLCFFNSKLLPCAPYAQEGYAFGCVGLCVYMWPKNCLFEVLPLENLSLL